MKRPFLFFVIVSTLFIACQNSQKLLNSGNYDQAIDLSSGRLQRNKANDKEIVVLEQAFKNDMEKDRARIDFLKREGRPENWDEIYLIYTHITKKQNLVKPLQPLFIKSQNRNASFEFTDVDADLIASKQKAAQYEYASSQVLLDKGDKTSARNAYEKLLRVRSLYAGYSDVENQISRARSMGMSYALYKMQNKSGIPLPSDFENELTKISLSDLNRTWLEYNTTAVANRTYDYIILVNMKIIDVGPEEVKENSFVESKVVDDGFQYVLDEKGNVKKDQNGNDIKVAKTKTITCLVTELHQIKKAIITGTLDYINNNNQQLIQTFPLAAENVFTNNALKAQGDYNALKPETHARLGSGPIPFPPGPAMILSAGQALKAKAKDIIWDKTNLLY